MKSLPDPDLNEDCHAVAAAVHGAAKTPPPADDIPANVEQMSDQEFEAWAKSLG